MTTTRIAHLLTRYVHTRIAFQPQVGLSPMTGSLHPYCCRGLCIQKSGKGMRSSGGFVHAVSESIFYYFYYSVPGKKSIRCSNFQTHLQRWRQVCKRRPILYTRYISLAIYYEYILKRKNPYPLRGPTNVPLLARCCERKYVHWNGRSRKAAKIRAKTSNDSTAVPHITHHAPGTVFNPRPPS